MLDTVMREAEAPDAASKRAMLYAQSRVYLNILSESAQKFYHSVANKDERARLKKALSLKPADDMAGQSMEMAVSQRGVTRDVLDDIIKKGIKKETGPLLRKIAELEAQSKSKNGKGINNAKGKGMKNAKNPSKGGSSGGNNGRRKQDFRQQNNAAGRANASNNIRGGTVGGGNGSMHAGGKKKPAQSGGKRGGKTASSRSAKRN